MWRGFVLGVLQVWSRCTYLNPSHPVVRLGPIGGSRDEAAEPSTLDHHKCAHLHVARRQKTPRTRLHVRWMGLAPKNATRLELGLVPKGDSAPSTMYENCARDSEFLLEHIAYRKTHPHQPVRGGKRKLREDVTLPTRRNCCRDPRQTRLWQRCLGGVRRPVQH